MKCTMNMNVTLMTDNSEVCWWLLLSNHVVTGPLLHVHLPRVSQVTHLRAALPVKFLSVTITVLFKTGLVLFLSCVQDRVVNIETVALFSCFYI